MPDKWSHWNVFKYLKTVKYFQNSIKLSFPTSIYLYIYISTYKTQLIYGIVYIGTNILFAL